MALLKIKISYLTTLCEILRLTNKYLLFIPVYNLKKNKAYRQKFSFRLSMMMSDKVYDLDIMDDSSDDYEPSFDFISQVGYFELHHLFVLRFFLVKLIKCPA